MASLLLDPFFQVTDSNGKPVSGAKINIYDGGTSDLADVYSEIGLSTALSQPIRTNSSGRIINGSNARVGVYGAGGQTYKVVITTSADASIDELDLIPGNIADNGGTLPIANGGTAASTAATARTSLGAAAQSDVDDLSTSIANVQAGIDGLPGGQFGTLAGKDDVSTAELASGFGVVILQDVLVDTDTTVVTCSNTMNYDNTIPQSSEGTEVLSGSVTPKSASSKLIISAFAQGAGSGSGDRPIIMAVFRDSGADALAFSMTAYDAGDSGEQGTAQLYLEHEMSSPGTSATTFKIRVGADGGTAFYVNGNSSGTRVGGGISKAWLRVREELTV